MKLDASKSNGEWEAAIANMPNGDASIDFTNGIISFQWRQTHDFSLLKGNIFIKDSGGDKSTAPIVVNGSGIGAFEQFNIPIGSFTSGTPADITDIVSIGFEVVDLEPAGIFYVDTLNFIISSGSMLIKLWDFGPTAPVAGVAKLSDATQYQTIGDLGIDGTVVSEITVSLLPGKRLYHIHAFSAGPAFEKSANSPLTVDNYYAITFHHVDEDIVFYGNNDGKLADSGGYSFTAEDESTAITATGADENLQFYLFCVKPVYVLGYHLHMLDADGVSANTGEESEWTTVIEDSNEVPVVVDEHHHHELNDYVYDDFIEYMELGGKFKTKYVPGNDDIVQIVQEIFYIYKPITVLS
jgi:hypothetical protein